MNNLSLSFDYYVICEFNDPISKWWSVKEGLLVFVADVVPIVPSAVGDDIVEVGVRKDDAGVLPHCPSHIKWAGSGHPTVYKCKPGFLVGRVSVLGRYRPESCCYWVKLTILLAPLS